MGAPPLALPSRPPLAHALRSPTPSRALALAPARSQVNIDAVRGLAAFGAIECAPRALAQLFALCEELLGGAPSALPLPGGSAATSSAAAAARREAGGMHLMERIASLASGREETDSSAADSARSASALGAASASAVASRPKLVAAIAQGAQHTRDAVATLGDASVLRCRAQAALCSLRLLFLHMLGLRRANLDIGDLTDLGLQTRPDEPPLLLPLRELLLELVCANLTPPAGAATPPAVGREKSPASLGEGFHLGGFATYLQAEAIAVLFAGERLFFPWADERAHFSRGLLAVLDVVPPAQRPTLPVALLANGMLRLSARLPGPSHVVVPIPAPEPARTPADAAKPARKIGFHCAPPQPKVAEGWVPPCKDDAEYAARAAQLVEPLLTAAKAATGATDAPGAAAEDAAPGAAVLAVRERPSAAWATVVPLLVRGLKAHAIALLMAEAPPLGGETLLLWTCATLQVPPRLRPARSNRRPARSHRRRHRRP